MVTIVWVGKPSHKGLGSIFLSKAKKKLNAVAYVIAVLIVFPFLTLTISPLLGLVGVGVVLVSVPVAFVMEKVSKEVFGGVSGDMIGATNEVARGVTLVLFAVVLMVIMMIPALIMAGGKGSRMGLPTEKPLLPFLGKPLIDWVADAILTAKKVTEFYVITSANTPRPRNTV